MPVTSFAWWRSDPPDDATSPDERRSIPSIAELRTGAGRDRDHRLSTTWHIVTGEYPPARGGVSDYTQAVSAGLAAAGDVVHVWCPEAAGSHVPPPGVHVHRVQGPWRREDLAEADAELDALPRPKRLLVQWVPHAYGSRALNVGFCRWVHRRSRAGDIVDLMVHEPFLAFGEGPLRQNVAAAVHRVMVALLLRAARRVWVAVPAWVDCLRPWAPKRHLDYCWLPVPSNVPVVSDAAGVSDVRSKLAGDKNLIIGHFSTYGPQIRRDLTALVPKLLNALPDAHLLLLGRGGQSMAAALQACAESQAKRICATGGIDAEALSRHLQACDLMVQPYPDGASTRRGTLMAALAHGVPVVTTVGRLSESFWQASPAVATVPAGQLSELLDAAVDLASDAARRREQSVRARELYEARFDVRHTVRALHEDACVTV